MVNQGKIAYKDKKKKTNVWMTGVFFYSMAWPLVMTSNLLHFVDFPKLLSKMNDKMKDKMPYLNIQHNSVTEDTNTLLMVMFE